MRKLLGIWVNIIIRSKILNESKKNILIKYIGFIILR